MYISNTNLFKISIFIFYDHFLKLFGGLMTKKKKNHRNQQKLKIILFIYYSICFLLR